MYFCANVSLHEFILLGSPEAAVNEKKNMRVFVLHVLLKYVKFHEIFDTKYYVVKKKVYGNVSNNFGKILKTFVSFV